MDAGLGFLVYDKFTTLGRDPACRWKLKNCIRFTRGYFLTIQYLFLFGAVSLWLMSQRTQQPFVGNLIWSVLALIYGLERRLFSRSKDKLKRSTNGQSLDDILAKTVVVRNG